MAWCVSEHLYSEYVSVNAFTGTKNVAKTLAKVIKGRRGNPVKDQLSEQLLTGNCDSNCDSYNVHIIGGSTKRHLYWCMRNCNSSPKDLQDSILNISKHYQVSILLDTAYVLFFVSDRTSIPTATVILLAGIQPTHPARFFLPTQQQLRFMRRL